MLSRQALSITAAAFSSPKKRIISAADMIAAIGLARSLPIMSKAAPWTGSKSDGDLRDGSRLEEWAMPMEPDRAAARSDRMLRGSITNQVCDNVVTHSPCRLVVTIVSRLFGLDTMRTVIAST
jgi:hypothetical protein